MKNKMVKKKGHRKSDRKTTLALLRSKLNVPKREGHYAGERVPLSVKDVSAWLGLAEDTVRAIERKREGYRLTQASARIIERQTGASSLWLLGKKASLVPITWAGTKLRQLDFDRAQAALKSPYRVPTAAHFALKNTLAKLVTILVQAAQHGQIDLYESKLEAALNDILDSFPANCAKVDFSNHVDRSTDHNTPDFKPLFAQYQQQLMKICENKLLISRSR
jgi:hypothetical protein